MNAMHDWTEVDAWHFHDVDGRLFRLPIHTRHNPLTGKWESAIALTFCYEASTERSALDAAVSELLGLYPTAYKQEALA